MGFKDDPDYTTGWLYTKDKGNQTYAVEFDANGDVIANLYIDGNSCRETSYCCDDGVDTIMYNLREWFKVKIATKTFTVKVKYILKGDMPVAIAQELEVALQDYEDVLGTQVSYK